MDRPDLFLTIHSGKSAANWHVQEFIGVFAGAMTSTPGLASVLDRIEAPAASAVFGAVYPVALLGSLYLLPALPALFRDDVESVERAEAASRQGEHRPRVARAYRIGNPNVAGRRLEEVRRLVTPDVVFTRYAGPDRNVLASDALVLTAGHTLVAVSPETEVASLEMLLGPSEPVPPHPPAELVSRKFIVSRAHLVGMTLAELDLEARLDAGNGNRGRRALPCGRLDRHRASGGPLARFRDGRHFRNADRRGDLQRDDHPYGQ